jgi:hypothetical protein
MCSEWDVPSVNAALHGSSLASHRLSHTDCLLDWLQYCTLLHCPNAITVSTPIHTVCGTQFCAAAWCMQDCKAQTLRAASTLNANNQALSVVGLILVSCILWVCCAWRFCSLPVASDRMCAVVQVKEELPLIARCCDNMSRFGE